MKTRYFTVDGDALFELWFNDAGVPVKFTEIGDDTTITYRLAGQPTHATTPILKGGMITP